MLRLLNISKFLLATFLLTIIHLAGYSQTFFGVSASNPLDNASSDGSAARAVIPPLLMNAGDLAVIYGHYRGSGASISISNTGGQTWVSEATYSGAANQTSFVAWCRFNGTWSANPSLTGPGANAFTVVMYVFRPSNPSNLWEIDVPQTNSFSTTATATINGVTTTKSNTVTMAFWGSPDDNTWGTLTGAGWSKTGLQAQIRNLQGTDQSQTAAYNIQATATTLANVSQTQTANGPDETNLGIITWYELATPLANDNCGGAVNLTSNTSCTNTTGTVTGATNSGIAVPSCGGTADDDVWYSFTAVQPVTSITLSSLGTSLSSSGARMELFSGGCGGLTSLACGNTSIIVGNLSPATQYFVRVYSAGSTALPGGGNFNICVTHVVPPANNECSGAVTLTSNLGCVNTSGTLNGATISAGIPAGCVSGSNTYDVWYQFTASSSSHSVQLSNYGSAYTRRQFVIYQGSCTGLTAIGCSSLSTSGTAAISVALTDLSPGITYFIRVLFNNTTATPITTNGGFDICVRTGTNKSIPAVTTGKSYTNITRPNGGVIMTGDVLEFRSTIGVGSWSASGSIYNVTFHDTIPGTNYTYNPNSIRLRTNEGLAFQSAITGTVNLTDASGDDEAVVSGNVIRVNVGSLTRTGGQAITQVGAAATPITYASAGGGKINHNGRPSQFTAFCIIVVTYRVTVTATTGSTFTSSNGQFRYKTTANPDDGAFPQTIIDFPRYSAFVSTDATLCQSSVGINTYSGGDFGSGTTRHDSTQLTTAPGYTWSPFNSGSPGDGLFAVINNTSSNGSTNKYIPTPTSGAGADTARVFRVWDIIGDHTNAANVDSGNFAVAPGTLGGYMGVVNAAYGINNAVQRTITGLCSDTYYEFSAWFKNICAACSSDSTGTQATSANFKTYLGSRTLNDSAGVSPDLTYTIDGVDYYTTGNIAYDRRWIKKGFLFKTGPSQSSVTLTIRNNAPGGGGNDWAIDDIGLATCLPRLTMRPSTNPTYCNNNQVTLSVAVSTFYDNYIYYFWERSTDGGATWSAISGTASSPLSYTYTTFSGGEYRDTVALPSFVANTSMNGYRYRIRTATSIPNLSSTTCAVYNTVDVITINVQTPCSPLPDQLLKFNVRLNDDKSILTWTSKDESLKGFEVERSNDGVNFKSIGYVPASGRNGIETAYTFNDPTAVTAKVYYRLKLDNFTGSNSYSNTLSVTASNTAQMEIANLVNPFRERISFQLNAIRSEEVLLQLTDALGVPVLNKRILVNKGGNAVAFEVPQQLAKGSYLLRVVSSSGSVHRIIQKQ
jgi:trimeric autotransporter adhesin